MKVKVVANRTKGWAVKLLPSLKALLKKSGHKVVDRGADATICVGGDGTILYAFQKGRIEGAVLGIGSERSFVCHLKRTQWRKVVDVLKRKTFKTPTLVVETGKERFRAINDVVFHSSDFRVLEIDVHNGKPCCFLGDGLIACTPIGSTAYAYSAGGKELSYRSKQMQLVPICPYRRAARHTTAKEAHIRVKGKSALIVDGFVKQRSAKGFKARVYLGEPIAIFEGAGKNK